MCGIVAYSGRNTAAARGLLEALLLEGERRGAHATGLAFLDAGQELCVFSEPLPARVLVEHYALAQTLATGPEQLDFVGHTRYSTSDRRWDQPLRDPYCALVMNGVISQDEPESWPRTDDDLVPYRTGNDAEVALRYAKNGYRGQMPGSFAVAELWCRGTVYAYRNTRRPLYLAWTAEGCFAASTMDMLHRVGLLTTTLLEPGVVIDLRTRLVAESFPVSHELQPPALDARHLRCLTA